MQNNTQLLFISVFNYGVIEMAKNHLKSLWQQGHTNTLSIVTDQASIDELQLFGYPCKLVLETDIKSEKKDFGTQDFNVMSYLRYYCISKLFENNNNFDVWYMDIDTVVTRNLTTYYEVAKRSKYDIWFQSDINMACTGCMLIIGSMLTYEFAKTVWTNKSLEHNDQLCVRQLLQNNPNVLKIGVFELHEFPCGVLYFSDKFIDVPENIMPLRAYVQIKMAEQSPVFIHANWMIGDDKKKAALKAHGLWLN